MCFIIIKTYHTALEVFKPIRLFFKLIIFFFMFKYIACIKRIYGRKFNLVFYNLWIYFKEKMINLIQFSINSR